MKKYTILALLWGWFFTISSSADGIKVDTKLSGFETKADCERKLAEIKDGFEDEGLKGSFSKCQYRQET